MQYLLIHGSWHGAWCWEPLLNLLELAGHSVECLDLPGHGNNIKSLVTYNDYYKCVEEAVVKQKEPVIIVSHSMSGIITAPLLDHYPDKIKHLFMIASYLPEDGKSMLDLALSYDGSEIPKILLPVNTETQTQMVDLSKVREVLYYDCSEATATWAAERLCPQPVLPMQTPITWDDKGTSKDKRTYIVCLADRDVPLVAQRDMAGKHPCHIVEMDSGHFPFFSHPAELTKIVAASYTVRG